MNSKAMCDSPIVLMVRIRHLMLTLRLYGCLDLTYYSHVRRIKFDRLASCPLLFRTCHAVAWELHHLQKKRQRAFENYDWKVMTAKE